MTKNNNSAGFSNILNRKLVMIADNYTSNLRFCSMALAKEYYIVTAPTVNKMFDIMEETVPSLVIISDAMPGMADFNAIKQLRAKEKTKDVPVLVIADRINNDKERLGLKCGVNEYLVRPINESALLSRAGNLINASRPADITDGQIRHSRQDAVNDALAEVVSELVERRDDVNGGHIDRTVVYLRVLMGAVVREGIYKEEISKWDIPALINAAQLHDIGKCMIPDSILLKPGKLTADEFDVMKMHTQHGIHILEKIENRIGSSEYLDHAKLIAGTHHEKWDGRGYPNGLAGKKIPLQGRLMAVVDVYDAFTTERPYKKAYTHEEAIKMIQTSSSAHFDPLITAAFLTVCNDFPGAVANI